jgi:2-polyprenyl-3-methyl-5-hydroxy-6-metoxy-1,4-benzoquinol methylase
MRDGNPIIQRDSLHHTRRFEYPWAFLNISPTCDSLLDMGSGGSSFTFYLTQFINRIVALDKDSQTVSEMNLIKRCNGRFHNLEPKCADLLDSGYEDNSFHTVISISVLEHTGHSNLIKAFDEMFRIARKTVLVTMDVRLEPYEERIYLKDLELLSKEYGFTVPSLNQLSLLQVLEEGHSPFAVACIRIDKE